MAVTHLSAPTYIATLSELVGYKSGLAINELQIKQFLQEDPNETHPWPKSSTDWIRVRHEEVEAALRWLLFKVGAISTPSTMPWLSWSITARKDPSRAPIVTDILDWFVQLADASRASDGATRPDFTALFDRAQQKHGLDGLTLAGEFYKSVAQGLMGSLQASFRTYEWQDLAELNHLFQSKAGPTHHGEYFDQRFINYLAQNHDDLGSIHWRQLERLTAEFFERAGFNVELGPGTNDEGIDVRVWRDADSTAPTILIQCKRQKESVERVVVKALYADVLHERAETGLVVTTSRLSPGAKRDCKARSYPIAGIEAPTLAKWIKAMRTPFAGVFLGE